MVKKTVLYSLLKSQLTFGLFCNKLINIRVAFMAFQLFRFKPEILYFNRDDGAEPTVMALVYCFWFSYGHRNHIRLNLHIVIERIV